MRNDQAGENTSPIGQYILAYLTEHPDAEDTLEGIMEWWLLEQKIKHQIAAVKEALSRLVNQGLVVEKRRQNISPLYCISPNKVQEVQELAKKLLNGKVFGEGNGD